MADGFTDESGYDSGFFEDSEYEDPDDASMDPLDKAVLDLRARDFGTRRTAVDTLERAGASAIPNMLNALKDADEALRDVVAGRLVRLGTAILPQMMSALEHPDIEARTTAAWVLGELEDSRAVTILIEKLDDDDPAMQEAAVEALERIANTRALDAARFWRGRQSGAE